MNSVFKHQRYKQYPRWLILVAMLLAMFIIPAQADEPIERRSSRTLISAANTTVSQTFDGTTTPDGWSVINNVGDDGWRFDNPGGRTNETGGQGNFAIADSDNAGEEVSMDTELRTPATDFSGSSSVQLKFQTYYKPYDSGNADVDVSTDGGNSWQTVWQASTAERKGLMTIDISNQAANQANVIIRFRYYNVTYQWYWQIDEVQIKGVGGTTAPSSLNAQTDSSSSIALQWADNSDNETAFEIERSTSSGGNFTKIANAFSDTTSYTNSGLACGTTYFYRVRAINASGASGYSNEASASTGTCAGATNLNENFDSQTNAPAGWGATSWVFDDSLGFANWLPGLTPNFASTDVDGAELRTPVLDLSSQSSISLNFDTYIWGNGKIDVSSDGGTTWQNVWNNSGNIDNGDPLRSRMVDISANAGGRSNVVIRFVAGSQTWWVVDNVALNTISAPTTPTNLTAAAGNNGTVNLSWSNPSNGGIQVQRSADGGTNWMTLITLAPGSTSYIDSQATTGQSYSYRVRATSSAGNSAFSNVANLQLSSSVKTFDIIVSLYHTTESAQANRTGIENNIKFFADAIYEMSNGAHRLGKVSFYPNNGFRTTADVIWIREGWPNAFVGGRARPTGPHGKRIEHMDIFTNGGNPINFLSTETSQRQGGYTLAHEWGHYFYSAYDEYVSSKTACNANRPGSPCNQDIGVEFSIMNSQFRAVGGDYRWLNFSVPRVQNQRNAQYRVHRASAWEMLTRPISQDPPYRFPRKTYYPELQNVQPTGNQLPSLELPGGQQAARAALQLVWPNEAVGRSNGGELSAQQAANNAVRQIVIDRSVNMSDEQLDNVKNAVNLLIDQAKAGAVFGIYAYDSSATQIQAPLMINDQTEKDILKAAVDSITNSTNDSATGEALQTALDDLVNGPDALNQVVYLITAGAHQTGEHPITVVSAYQDAFVSLFTFGYGVEDGVATTLEQIAEETGGFYRFVGNRSDLQRGLNAADKIAVPVSPVYITLSNALVDSNDSYDGNFYVDSTLGGLEVGVSYLNEQAGASLSLIDGSGNTISTFPAESCEDWSGVDFDIETICYASIDTVTAGEWTLRVESLGEEVDLLYWVDGLPGDDANTYRINLESNAGEEIAYPEPILVRAAVGTQFPTTDINVQGEIYGPDDSYNTFTLKDDGVAPDETARDGIYTALLNYSSNGYHYINVAFDNGSDTGQFTDVALFPAKLHSSPDSEGNPPEAGFTPVGEKFQRYAEIQVNVTGVAGDDHADYLFDESNSETDLPVDNTEIAGQIDFADDSDTFKVTIPDDYTGELVVRVANLGFDMDPYLYLVAEDFSWEAVEFLDFIPTSTDYLNVALTVGDDVAIKPGSIFYVQVYHFEEDAAAGTYSISAGPPLSSEIVASSGEVKASNEVYLPIVIK